MAQIKISSKLSTVREEYAIYSGNFVFFRLIADRNCAKFMTATASEDFGSLRAFGDQSRLIACSCAVLSDRNLESALKEDRQGRPYVESEYIDDGNELEHIVTSILDLVGCGEDVDVVTLRDLLTIYEEFSPDDEGNDAYLSDGVWVTKDGRLVSK